MTRVMCLHCGSTYDLGHVETVARYADCTVYITPCCKRQVDDRKWVPSPAFRELSADEAARPEGRHTAPTAAVIGIRDDGEDWRHNAACLGEDPDLFFSGEWEREPERTWRIEEAQAVCWLCPVKDACLRWALDNSQDHGVWGGLTEDERRGMRRAQARTGAKPPTTRKTTPAPPAKATPTERPACGTRSGYEHHTRRRERQCDACRAWKAADRANAAVTPACGTLAGYRQHQTRREATCAACRAAKAADSAQYRRPQRRTAA